MVLKNCFNYFPYELTHLFARCAKYEALNSSEAKFSTIVGTITKNVYTTKPKNTRLNNSNII